MWTTFMRLNVKYICHIGRTGRWEEGRVSFPGCCIHNYVRGVNLRMGSATFGWDLCKSTLPSAVGECP